MPIYYLICTDQKCQREIMNISLILGHPRRGSFNHAIAFRAKDVLFFPNQNKEFDS